MKFASRRCDSAPSLRGNLEVVCYVLREGRRAATGRLPADRVLAGRQWPDEEIVPLLRGGAHDQLRYGGLVSPEQVAGRQLQVEKWRLAPRGAGKEPPWIRHPLAVDPRLNARRGGAV